MLVFFQFFFFNPGQDMQSSCIELLSTRHLHLIFCSNVTSGGGVSTSKTCKMYFTFMCNTFQLNHDWSPDFRFDSIFLCWCQKLDNPIKSSWECLCILILFWNARELKTTRLTLFTETRIRMFLAFGVLRGNLRKRGEQANSTLPEIENCDTPHTTTSARCPDHFWYFLFDSDSHGARNPSPLSCLPSSAFYRLNTIPHTLADLIFHKQPELHTP